MNDEESSGLNCVVTYNIMLILGYVIPFSEAWHKCNATAVNTMTEILFNWH